MTRRINQIIAAGPRTAKEQAKLWRYREAQEKRANRRGTQEYMDRMDTPRYNAEVSR
jgi:hypothetical protein